MSFQRVNIASLVSTVSSAQTATQSSPNHSLLVRTMAEVAPHEPMAAVSDSDSVTIYDHPPPRMPTEEGNSSDELRRWADYAVAQAISVKQVLGATADSTITAAGSGLSHLRSASLHGVDIVKGTLELAKNQYATYENLAIEKIKEGVSVVAVHPELSCGVAAGLGLIVLKRPRRFLIHKTRRIFISEESLLSQAEAKVNELRQSINLVKNESKKLEERALKAEEEMKRGLMTLAKEGREIQGELHFVGKIEREARGLKDFLGELPRREASRYHSEVSALMSQVNKEKKALSRTTTKIINYGIPL